MEIEFLEESKLKKSGKKENLKSDSTELKSDSTESKPEIKAVKKTGLDLIDKKDMVYCERRDSGMTDNCVLCQELNKEMFIKCSNKWQ